MFFGDETPGQLVRFVLRQRLLFLQGCFQKMNGRHQRFIGGCGREIDRSQERPQAPFESIGHLVNMLPLKQLLIQPGGLQNVVSHPSQFGLRENGKGLCPHIGKRRLISNRLIGKKFEYLCRPCRDCDCAPTGTDRHAPWPRFWLRQEAA